MAADADGQGRQDEALEEFFNDFFESDDENDADAIGRYIQEGNAHRNLTNAAQDTANREDEGMNWEADDGEPQVILEFDTDKSGLQVQVGEAEPINFFEVLFPGYMWETIVTETNKYADNRRTDLEALNQLKTHSRLKRWKPVTVDELKIFIALTIAMGLTGKHDVDSYWSTEEMEETPFFGSLMSRDRFLIILSNLHVNDNAAIQSRSDPLHKIRPLLTVIQRTFTDVYVPGREISFDEGTCPWKGRVKFKVYNPQKPNKFGIKLFQVCEAATGYTVGFDIYTGAVSSSVCMDLVEELGVDPDCTKTTKQVVGLLGYCGLLTSGHHIYLDNYYSSPELFTELFCLDTYTAGTVRKNRKEVPKAFSKVKLRKGECIYRRRDHLLAVKYHDKRDVHMLSTIHQATGTEVTRRDGSTLLRPDCIADYVQYMRGVDVSDQMGQYYTLLRKTQKWWKKLFFHLVNLVIVNAYTLHRQYGSNARMSQHHFRVSLARELVTQAKDAPCPGKRGRKSMAPVQRLTSRCFPTHIPAAAGAKRLRPLRDCKACNPSKGSRDGYKRRQTSYWCQTCLVPLCVPKCFAVYHTVLDYKKQLCGRQRNTASDSSDSEIDAEP